LVLVAAVRICTSPPEPPSVLTAETAGAVEPSPEKAVVPAPSTNAPSTHLGHVTSKPLVTPDPPVSKAQRLAELREMFRKLAAGDPATALRAAKQVADPTERETALLALLTEWKQGELDPPIRRARAIVNFGLEAGLGLELVKYPDLAVLWANELTSGPGRTAILSETATTMADSDPNAAFALSQQLPQDERRLFVDSLLGNWAQKDTDAALLWAEQLSDDGERAAALLAIRSVAPVGIGAELSLDEGYPTIRQLVSGNAADFSGQLHQGDRILAVAQGDNAFTDVRRLSLQDVVGMIRGTPGTVVQLQILPANAPPDAVPQTVSIVRGQVKFKR
jgi:hypothetical protein